MKLSKAEYKNFLKQHEPRSNLVKDCVWAFCVGGLICTLGEAIRNFYLNLGFTKDEMSMLTSGTLILLSAILTSAGVYHKLGAKAGAGTLVPITGFANAVVSPAIEFKTEGFVAGVGSKMFVIAGPVIVYGTFASVLWGIVYYFIKQF